MKIRDGAKLFETHETRKLKRLSWVPVPNKHDGKGYRRIIRLEDGPMIYAAWLLILQVASKCEPRWVLADSDGPITPRDLSDKTGFPERYFELAYKYLPSKEIGWLEDTERKEIPGDSPDTPGDSGRFSRTKGREGKGIEGKGKEEKIRGAASRPASSWSSEACDDWQARFGGTAPGGKIGRELKPLVTKHGWEVVRPVWQRYLAEKDAEFATPADFAQKFDVWRSGGPRASPAKQDGGLEGLRRFGEKLLKGEFDGGKEKLS